MKLTKKTIGNEEVYFENGVKKYTYYKDSNGFETWSEYDSNDNVIHSKSSRGYEYWREFDKNDNLIHSKDSNGGETWSDENPKNMVVEVDIEPFTFTTEKTMTQTLEERRAEAWESWYEAEKAYKSICREIEEEGK